MIQKADAPEIQVVYKACRKVDVDSRWVSIFAAPPFQRVYDIGQKTFPMEGSLLYAFCELEIAEKTAFFIGSMILECNAEVVKVKKPWMLEMLGYHYAHFTDEDREAFDRFWSGGGTGYKGVGYYDISPAPKGTVFCKWIKPIRVVCVV